MVKTMLILLFNRKGVIHHEYVPEGQIVNIIFYIQVLSCLCKHIAHVMPEMWREVLSFPQYRTFVHSSDCAAVFGRKRSGTVQSSSILTRFNPPSQLFRFPKIKTGAERFLLR